MSIRHWLLALCVCSSLVVSAAADPLDPEQVPADAKWLMHVDFDAFHDTLLAEHIRKTKLDNPLVKKWLDMVADKYGIDIRSGLHGLTAYGLNFEQNQGVALLAAKFDRDKALAVLQKQPGYSASKHDDVTFHTFQKRHHHKHHKGDDDKAKESNKEHATHTMVVVLLDDLAVMGSDEKLVQQALSIIDGDAPHLKRRSSLLGERPDGTVLYAAVQDISALGKHCEKLGRLAIVQQGDSACLAVGEDPDDIAFYHGRYSADSADVAELVGQMAAGFKAMINLHSMAHKELAPVVEGFETEVDGDTVYVDWEAEASDVMELHKKHEQQRRAWREKHGKKKAEAAKDK